MLPGAFFIAGIAGSGKSTIARHLAGRFDKGAHIEGDALVGFFVTGRVAPNETPRDEAIRQLELRERNLACLADNLANAGFVPVIDDTMVSQERLNYFKRCLKTRPLRLVILTPPREVARQRELQRGRQVGRHWPHLEMEMRRELASIGLWIDNQDLSPREAVELILAKADEADV